MPKVKLSFFILLFIATPSLVFADVTYTFHLDGVDPGIRTQIENSVTEAVGLYNKYGSFNKHLHIYYDPGVPTAQANYDGVITFGGSRNTRVALHEMGHTMGIGTHWNWSSNLSGGVWIGEYGAARIQEINGPGAEIHGDGAHFWPYGLNYDSEDGFVNRIRHIRMVAALRCDMGILSFALEPAGQVVPLGDTAVFTVQGVNGSGYQWYKQGNPTPLSNGADISGATTDTLQIANVEFDDEGYYYCVFSGSLSSRPARLMVEQFVGHWEFEDNADDSVGSNHGTTSGSPSYDTGKIDLAIDLDGLDDYVTLPAGIADTYDITVMTWVNWDGGGDPWQRVFDFGTSTDQYLFLTPRSASNTLRFAIKDGGSEQILETTQLATSQWIHLAVTLRSSVATLYIDGVVADTDSGFSIFPIDFEPTNNYIGDSQWSSDPFFDGRIDDFRIYNYPLRGSEIWNLWGESLNNPPLFTSDPVIEPDATEDIAYSGQTLADNASDLDGDPLVFSKVAGPDWLNIAANGTLSGTAGDEDVGENTFFIRVTDPSGATDDGALIITVINTNDPPFWLSDPFSKDSVTRNQPYSGSLAEDADDIDVGDTLVFSKTAGPDWLSVASDGTLSGTPAASDVGLNSFTVRVTDSSDAYDEATLYIAVYGVELISHYKFENNADDYISMHHGTVTGSVTYPTGRINQAIDLDGAEDYVTLPAGMVNIDDFTISVWVKWDIGGEQWQRIFDFGNNTTQYMFLTPRSGDDTLRFAIATAGNGAEQRLDTSQLTAGQWRHVAVTLQGDVGTLYVGGSPVATNTSMSLNPSDFNPAVNYIGESQFDDPLFDGKIDDFRIYNFALSDDDIAMLAEGNANNPPAFVSDPFINEEAIEDSSYSGPWLPAYAYDLDGDTLTFSAYVGPEWLTVAPNGSLSGAPSDSDTGWNIFGITAEDTGGLDTSAAMVIFVENIYSGVRGFEDLQGFTENWPNAGCTDTPACGGADLDGDKDVDFFDYVILVDNWPTE